VFEIRCGHSTGIRLRGGTIVLERAGGVENPIEMQSVGRSDHFGLGEVVLPLVAEEGREVVDRGGTAVDFAESGGRADEGGGG